MYKTKYKYDLLNLYEIHKTISNVINEGENDHRNDYCLDI